MFKKKNNTVLFFSFLFVLLFFLFYKTFQIGFFQDDYFFLQVSRINSLPQFLNFFSLNKGYSYRPLAGELFYFFINLFGKNPFIGYLIVFGVYFIGLIYLYKTVRIITINGLFSKIFIFLIKKFKQYTALKLRVHPLKKLVLSTLTKIY